VGRGTTVCTFHALCVRLLREFAGVANMSPNFTIYDSDEQVAVVKEAIARLDLPTGNFTPGAVHAAISRAKNKLQDAAAYPTDDFFGRHVAKVYGVYEAILRQNNALDFDDLLLRTAMLMRDQPDARAQLAQRYRYILIDEYQDTNHAQYVIAHGIAMDHENICVTGDPDQSIYGWRGANIGNILEFESDYPNAVVVRLEDNYRSFQPILTAASNLIAHNRQRKAKQLIAARGVGPEVTVIRLSDEHAEAGEVARLMTQMHNEGLAYRDMAVFYRVNALSRVLEQAFRRSGIPYQIARGVEFYNRKEIKDVLAYLRLMVNPRDDVACERIINVPTRGIGATTVNRLAASAVQRGTTLLEACGDPGGAGVGKGPSGKVAGFARLMAELTAAVDGLAVKEIVEMVVARAGIEAMLTGDEERRQNLKNVEELITSAAEFDGDHPGSGLSDYLTHVSLVSDVDAVSEEAGAVTFMTLHAAKGLEFRVVFVIGCEEGLLPFVRESGSPFAPATAPRDMEEERRLAFVGMTRAMDKLFLTCARQRMLRGQTGRQVCSKFLTEIGADGVVWLERAQPEAPPRHGRVSLDEFQSEYDGPQRDRFHDAEERAIVEAMEEADFVPPQFAWIQAGRRVRHEKFGTGVVQDIRHDGQNTRVNIQFDKWGMKTLVLQFTSLEPM
jgi:DNA helicase-2/ATP-dependent DNA helicase PcrA